MPLEFQFVQLEKNFHKLLSYCSEEAEFAGARFSTPTVLQKEYAGILKGSRRELLSYRLVNEGMQEKDVFIAEFKRFFGNSEVKETAKISSLLLMENLELAKEQVKQALQKLQAQQLE